MYSAYVESNLIYCVVCRRVGILSGHSEEISNCLFNHDCKLIASSSMDKTARVWDQRTYSSLATIMGHNDEVGKIKQK
jgi:dynein assembly factor with WDR repeat domains 1